MYRWHMFKKLIFGNGCRASRSDAPRPPTRRTASRRALQAELMALDRLGRGKNNWRL